MDTAWTCTKISILCFFLLSYILLAQITPLFHSCLRINTAVPPGRGKCPEHKAVGSRLSFSGHGQDSKFSSWFSWAAWLTLGSLALIMGSKTELGQTQHCGINRRDRDNKYSKFFSFLSILWEFILICVVAVQWGTSTYWSECLQVYLTTPPVPELNYDGKPPCLYKASFAVISLPFLHMSSL